VVENDGRDARYADEIALQHAQRQAGCNSSIDGVTAGFQYRKPGVRCQVVTCRDCMPAC